jgi:hypothetical protein
MEVSGQLYSQGKSPWYPLDRRLSGPQSQSGFGCKEKILFHWLGKSKLCLIRKQFVPEGTSLRQVHTVLWKLP